LKRSTQILVEYGPSSNRVIHLKKTDQHLSSFSRGRGINSVSGNTLDQKRVMICDDESDVLRAYKIARGSRYDILTAVSGEECLRKYESEVRSGGKVDVLLLDYKLGDMGGDEVACKIRDMDGTKIILKSAYEISSTFLNELKRRKCITTFVKKPITMAALLTTVEKTLLE